MTSPWIQVIKVLLHYFYKIFVKFCLGCNLFFVDSGPEFCCLLGLEAWRSVCVCVGGVAVQGS